MPKLDNWDEFAAITCSMYEKNPNGCRLTIKYRHNDGKLNIKVTDNKEVYQYLAEQQKEVKNVDKLMSTVMRSMTS